MSLQLRTTTNDPILLTLVSEFNKLRDGMVGTNFHASATSRSSGSPPVATVLQVTAAAPTTLATRIALANNIKAVLNEHFADSFAHNSAASAAITTANAATLESEAITLANACKAAYGTHLAEANVHFTNDATNTIAAANATNTASLDTLLAELKLDINAHISAALAGQHLELVNA